MTFKELQEETAGRGFSDLFTDATQLPRLKRWINQAYRELCEAHPWPFLEATKEGTTPLEIADLGHVRGVANKTVNGPPLTFIDRRQVAEWDPTLATQGRAEYWYLEGETSLRVYPAEPASTFVIRYTKSPAKLVADGDLPVVPEQYQDMLVDGATVRALKNRDNYEAAQFVRQEWKLGLATMRHALLKPNYDRDRKQRRTGAAADYLR